MGQIYYTRFMIFVLPVIVGILLGVILWKRRTEAVSWVILLLDVILWCILTNINTHGSEAPGLLIWMFSLFAISFAVVEVIKKIRSRWP